MSDRFESLESGEVVSIQHEAEVLSGFKTFKSGDLNDAIRNYVANAISSWSEEKNDWFTDRGINCEALRFGSKGWQKGRIRLSLEFCPDEPELPSIGARKDSIPVVSTAPKITIESSSISPTPVVNPIEENEERIVLEVTTSAPVAVATMPAANPSVVGIAATSAVAAAVAISPQDLEPVSISSAIPHHTDTVLELEHHNSFPSSPQSGGLDEILFDFDLADDRGRMIPNGTMELEVGDSLDLSEHDLLSFEANGMSDSSEGFGNFQDIDRPEHSGMLIDEVWNEMNQASWPKIS